MSILGTLIDKVALQTFAGTDAAGGGMRFASAIHSLPATTPDLVIPNLRSVQAINGQNINLCAIAANQSLSTTGVLFPSSASQPAVAWDTWAFTFHSVIR